MEQLYKITEASKILSVTRQTVTRWIKEGKIQVVRINGNPRIKESELKRLMEGE